MEFEYDPAKSLKNKDKHGIDFEEAQLLWSDAMLVQIPAKTVDEPRTLWIGKINTQHWSAITTARDNKLRLISVRRARKKEIEFYESL